MSVGLLLALIVVAGLIGLLIARTAYREGVCDGYRYARHPFDPRHAHLIPVLRAAKLVPPSANRRRRER